ncbi:MAG TPA: hypothetical protein VKA35_01285 [Solirubrobacterales bacterium]|nr:hypothetical protein [Solirubrobacterales bacterium]
MKIEGTLTLKRAGTDARTCTVLPTMFLAGGDEFEASNASGNSLELKCTNGMYLRWFEFHGNGFLKEGKQMMAIAGGTPGVFINLANPWGETTWYANTVANVPWTNATATTPSKVVFSENKIGETASWKSVTASGTLYFKTMFGGNITLP